LPKKALLRHSAAKKTRKKTSAELHFFAQRHPTTLNNARKLAPTPPPTLQFFCNKKPLSLAKKLSGRCIFYLIFT
jgi:hypothetical protein